MGNLVGFQVLFRLRFLLLSQKIVSNTAFILWEYYLAVADWDKKHSTYGSFDLTVKELAKGLAWSESTISRVNKELIKYGLIGKESRRIKLRLFWMTEPKNAFNLKSGKYDKLENHKPSELQDAIAFLQGNLAFLQENKGKNKAKTPPISDIKCSYKSVNVRTDQDYQRIYEEGGYKFLTPDDMYWINENIPVRNYYPQPTLEENVIEIFFNGDRDKYKKSFAYE